MPFRRLIPLFLLIFFAISAHTQCYYPPGGANINPTGAGISPYYWAPGYSYNVVLTDPQGYLVPDSGYTKNLVGTMFIITLANAGEGNFSTEDPNVTVTSPLTWVSPTEDTFSVSVGSGAPVGGDAWSLMCINSSTNTYVNTAYSNGAGVEITPCAAPTTPTITSITPSNWVVGQATNITINGSGFFANTNPNGCSPSGLEISVPSGSIPFTYNSVVGSTQITATVTPGASDPAEAATVTVSNYVYNPPPDTLSATATANVVLCAVPTVSTVSPNVWTAGQSYPITITGTGFVTAAKATKNCPVSTVTAATPSTNPAVSVAVSGISVVSATEITATVEATAAGSGGITVGGGGAPLVGATYATITVAPTPASGGGGGIGAAVPVRMHTKSATAEAVTPETAGAPAGSAYADILLPPQIVCSGSWMQCNGKAISVTSGTPTPQTAVVGEQIYLTTTPTYATLEDLPIYLTLSPTPTWTVGGTNIGGYTVATDNSSASVAPTTLTGSTLTTYWVYPGDAIPVTYESCVEGQTASPIYDQCITATATFNVMGPTDGTMSFAPFSPGVSIANLTTCILNGTTYPGGPWMIYAQGANGTVTGTACPGGKNITAAGITFNTPTGYANSSGGSFSLVQLISNDVSTVTTNAPGLDTGYPYPGGGPPSNDNPSVNLPSNLTSVSRNFNANMFLMWKSTITNSIPVPLGYQNWGFSGIATCSTNCGTAGNWTAANTVGTTPGPVGNFIPSDPSQTTVGNNVLQYGYPTWTTISH